MQLFRTICFLALLFVSFLAVQGAQRKANVILIPSGGSNIKPAMVGKWHVCHIHFDGKKQLNYESNITLWEILELSSERQLKTFEGRALTPLEGKSRSRSQRQQPRSWSDRLGA